MKTINIQIRQLYMYLKELRIRKSLLLNPPSKSFRSNPLGHQASVAREPQIVFPVVASLPPKKKVCDRER